MRARVAALVLGLGACGSLRHVPQPDDALARLARAEARWRAAGVRSYRFEVAYDCACRWDGRGRRIEVHEGAVNADASLRFPEDSLLAGTTVEELFRKARSAVERWRDGKIYRAEVAYDDRFGYPRSIFTEYDRAMTDDQLRVVVRRFAVLP